MPMKFVLGTFVLYFWAGENNEPIHVHVGVRRPADGDAKFWLTNDGGCIVARPGDLSKRDLRDIQRFVVQNHAYIVSKWVEFYEGIEPRFYQ